MIRITAPVRVDIGGGVTDIPEFAAAVGTSLINIGVDLFEDSSYIKPLTISVELSDTNDFQNVLLYNGYPQTLDIKQKDKALFIKSFINAVIPQKQKYEISITNHLPRGTGLGASGCLSVLLTSLFADNLDPSFIINTACHIEVEKLGIKGGFQDFIGAFFGNVNFISANKVDDINFAQEKTFGMKLKPELKKYLDENMIVIVRKNNNIPSEVVVTDEVKNYQKSPEIMSGYVHSIKRCNIDIFSILKSDIHLNSTVVELGKQMMISWEAQKLLSKYVCSGIMADIEKTIKPYVHGLRGPGAAGNSLFMICKNNKQTIINALKPFQKEVNVYYLKTNNSGILKEII